MLCYARVRVRYIIPFTFKHTIQIHIEKVKDREKERGFVCDEEETSSSEKKFIFINSTSINWFDDVVFFDDEIRSVRGVPEESRGINRRLRSGRLQRIHAERRQRLHRRPHLRRLWLSP